MSRFVVDASVAVKWVVPEVHADAARRLLGRDYDLLVPDIFYAETANVFWKRVHRGQDRAERAKVAFAAIKVQPLKVYSSATMIDSAFELALQTQRAVYDCIYLTLAVEHQCQMVTADEKFFNALQSSSLSASLCWLEALP